MMTNQFVDLEKNQIAKLGWVKNCSSYFGRNSRFHADKCDSESRQESQESAYR